MEIQQGKSNAVLFSMRDLLYTLLRHKLTILIVFLTSLVTTTIGVYLWPKTYEARAKVLLKVGRENVAIPAGALQQQIVTSLGLSQEDINSEIEILNNRHIIAMTVEKLGTDFLFPEPVRPKGFVKVIKFEVKRAYKAVKRAAREVLYWADLKKRLTPFESAVEALEAGLSVTQVRESNVIEVRLAWFNPEIARHAVDTLIDLYLDRHVEAYKSSEEYDFLKKQVDVIGERLRGVEDRLLSFKKENKVASYDDQVRFLLEKIAYFNFSLKNTRTEIAEAESKIKEIGNQLSLQRESILLTSEQERNPLVDMIEEQLVSLELKKEELKTKYLADSEPVTMIQEEIDKVRERLKAERSHVEGKTTSGVNVTYKELEKELVLERVRLDSLKEKERKLTGHIASYQAELDDLNSVYVSFMELNRQVKIEEQSYELYRKKMEEVRISDVMDSEGIVGVSVIAPPRAFGAPVSPRKLLIIGLGGLFGMMSAVGFAFLFECLDHSISTPEDVQRYLGLSVLGSIGERKPSAKA